MERRTSLVARLVGRHPVAADWLLTAVVTLAALGQRFGMPEDATPVRSTALGVLFAVAGSVPVAWRRRSPLGVLAVTELVVLVELALEFDRVGEAGGVGPGVVVALYTVATSCPWPVSAWAAAVVVGLNTAVLLALRLFADGVGDPDPVPALLLLGGSWLVGDNVRTRRAYTAELEERAARLEREREAKAVRAVAEERARISRELHDVVAHTAAWSDGARWLPGQLLDALAQGGTTAVTLSGLLRRERAQPDPEPPPDLGAPRPTTHLDPPVQLEEGVDGGGALLRRPGRRRPTLLPRHGWQLRHRHPHRSAGRAATVPGRGEGHAAAVCPPTAAPPCGPG
jgi:Histidine kinase